LTQKGRQRKQTKTIVYRSRKASLNSMGAAERTEETMRQAKPGDAAASPGPQLFGGEISLAVR
jgi:hypothetical protein